MFDLTKQEKIILIFLSLSFVAGLGVSAYKKSRQELELDIQPYKIDSIREKSDEFIERQRSININTFKIDELTRLPGVGEKIAARILDYHKMHGPFKAKEELMQVKGIGQKKLEKIKELIVLE